MPLVWISDYYRLLKYPHLAFKYLLLSGISDAIKDEGKVNPDAGFYWRARWQEKISDDQIARFYDDAFAEYKTDAKYKFFPEFILARIGIGLVAPYPSIDELDLYAFTLSILPTRRRSSETLPLPSETKLVLMAKTLKRWLNTSSDAYQGLG